MWTVRNRSELEAVNESELLVGHITEGGHDWVCRATGGTDGISLGDPDGLLHVSVRGSGTPGSGSDLLPVAGEHYVKSDQWKIDFPQTTGEYSLRLSIRVVESTATRCLLEPTFSIQTSLLDTHPTLDLKSVGGTVGHRVLSAPTSENSTSKNSGPVDAVSVWTIAFAGNAGMIAVMLGPHDAPFTTDQSSEDKIQLQLFGEFLEKGVIRKARPWIVLDRSEGGITDDELAALADALCRTPLPLVF